MHSKYLKGFEIELKIFLKSICIKKTNLFSDNNIYPVFVRLTVGASKQEVFTGPILVRHPYRPMSRASEIKPNFQKGRVDGIKRIF